jgi:IS30 family transposase
MANETSAKLKANKQAAKLEARKERNEAQAVIERDIWAQVNAQAEQAVTVAKRKQGAPSMFTVELGQEIVTRLANGQSLHSICKLDHMPHISTIYDWIGKEPSFAEHYGRAREHAAHTLFDQMLDIADDSSADLLADGSANNAAIARARLQIETRARVAGKLAPKVYGERIEALAQTVNVTNNNLTIDAQSLGADQRNALRSALIAARDSKTIDN